MLRGLSPDNLRFIIIDHETLTTTTDMSIPTTPVPTRITRKRQNNTSPEPSTAVQNVARSLSYDPSVNTYMQTLLHDAPEELPYKELTVATHVIADLDNITVLMLDMFGMMQENMSEAIDVCNKILHDHQTP
ncbi:unnamed protein product [Lactuca saligna]|uniref:Uncharacterized protein n=1 Tax=Lactuca saligna TaxID=75948 RepID=A0AA35ZF43_LACSI|nr:unnamed protein product [Lactuca saligna]